jgi:hypothetical protein
VTIVTEGTIERVPKPDTWRKIAEVDVPPGSTAVDITGLNGNRDKFYRILFQGLVSETPTGGDVLLVVIPNALPGLSIENLDFYTYFDGNTTGTGVGRYTLAGLLLTRNGWGLPVRVCADATISAMTGRERQMVGISHGNIPDRPRTHLTFITGGFWEDTSTNITSLRIAVSSNTFSGRLMLFKT